jgi:hypothetical protein
MSVDSLSEHRSRSPHSLDGTIPSSRLAPWLVFAGMLLFLQFRPIHDVDIFWQVRLGELTLQRGELIAREPFSAAHADEPMPQLYWLSQIFYALIHRLGGWQLLHGIDAAIWAGGFLAVGLGIRRDEAVEAALAVALVLGFMAALPFASLRPQSWGVLCFGLLLSLTRSRLKLWMKAALGFPLLVVWQNLHPSVLIAGLALGPISAVGWVLHFRRGDDSPWGETILAGLSVIAAVLTPVGTDIFRVSADNADRCRQLVVGEWQPLWSSVNIPASITAWLALAVTAWLLFRGGRSVRAKDLAAGLVLAAMSLLAYRFVLFWAMAMVPVWARCLSPVRIEQSVRPAGWRGFHAPVLVAVALALAVLVPILVQPRLFIDYLPLEGAARLRERAGPGVVYNYPAWAGVLLSSGNPDWHVAYDGRYYRYSKTEWREQQAAAAGLVPLAEIERRWRPVAFFLRPKADDALIALVRADGGWEEIYSDGNCVVFVARKLASG